jgi:AAA+ ATPase superfamily predicted ATPase
MTHTANLTPYLKRLLELKLIERRIPATIPLAQRKSTTRSRYHLSDSYLRFYYRFVEPNLVMIEQGQIEALWRRVSNQFCAFVGMTTFEELCREWVIKQAQASQLPFTPDLVGSHWAPDAQIDVVAISWQEKAILLGECKWGVDPIRRSIVRELVEKKSKVMPG